jgi:hypothetical protein
MDQGRLGRPHLQSTHNLLIQRVELVMSLPEKLYLAVVLFAFASFAIMLATLAWLDGRVDKRKQAARSVAAAKPVGQVAHQPS